MQAAQKVEHFKVLSELILQGADTTTLTFRHGDTPIHAALTLVLEKTRGTIVHLALTNINIETYSRCG